MFVDLEMPEAPGVGDNAEQRIGAINGKRVRPQPVPKQLCICDASGGGEARLDDKSKTCANSQIPLLLLVAAHDSSIKRLVEQVMSECEQHAKQ
jgi:hypothetical protein